MRAVKMRAVEEDRTLKDLVADLLRRGMAADAKPVAIRNRVQLPLVRCAHAAAPGEEITPDRAAAIPIEQEAEASLGYLAPFAATGGHRIVTTDTAFRQFDGLDLLLLDRP